MNTGGIALVGAERLVELAPSKRNAARAFARGGVEVGAGHYRVMTALHTLFLGACVAEPWLLGRAFPGALDRSWTLLAAGTHRAALAHGGPRGAREACVSAA